MWINQFEMVGTCSTHESDEGCSGLYSEILKGRDCFGTLRTEGADDIEIVIKEIEWPRMGIGCVLCWTRP